MSDCVNNIEKLDTFDSSSAYPPTLRTLSCTPGIALLTPAFTPVASRIAATFAPPCRRVSLRAEREASTYFANNDSRFASRDQRSQIEVIAIVVGLVVLMKGFRLLQACASQLVCDLLGSHVVKSESRSFAQRDQV